MGFRNSLLAKETPAVGPLENGELSVTTRWRRRGEFSPPRSYRFFAADVSRRIRSCSRDVRPSPTVERGIPDGHSRRSSLSQLSQTAQESARFAFILRSLGEKPAPLGSMRRAQPLTPQQRIHLAAPGTRVCLREDPELELSSPLRKCFRAEAEGFCSRSRS